VTGFGGTTATLPPGWLLCNGAEYAGTAYPDLFAVIGTLYGTPGQTGNFRVPDLRGRYVVMADHGSSRLSNNTNGASPFLAEGALANDMSRMPRAGAWATNSTGAHTHNTDSQGNHGHTQTTYRTSGSSQGGTNQFGHATDNDFPQTSTINAAGAHTHTVNANGAHTHTISGGDYQSRPESVVANYIIKT